MRCCSSCQIKSYVKKQRSFIGKRKKNAVKGDELACGAVGACDPVRGSLYNNSPCTETGSWPFQTCTAEGARWAVAAGTRGHSLWEAPGRAEGCWSRGCCFGASHEALQLSLTEATWTHLSLGVTYRVHGGLLVHALGGDVQGWPLFGCQPSADFSRSGLAWD